MDGKDFHLNQWNVLYYIITSAKGFMFCHSLLVCLSASRIAQMLIGKSSCKFQNGEALE